MYSLGCTLYYLLTGRAPFPGGSVTEKLLRHVLDTPTPVEELRPEVPPAVADVVRKMMAKQPGDRYQTPTEAVAALTALEEVIASCCPASTRIPTAAASGSREAELVLMDAPAGGRPDVRATADTIKLPRLLFPEKPGRRRRWLLAGIVGLVLLGLAGFHLALHAQARPAGSSATVQGSRVK